MDNAEKVFVLKYGVSTPNLGFISSTLGVNDLHY